MPVRSRCGAKTKRTDAPCRAWPDKGGTRCRRHGGGTALAKAKARRAVLEEQARRAVMSLDADPGNDPMGVLSWMAGEAVAWKNLMAGLVEGLAQWRYQSVGGFEQLRAEVALFERAMDRCVHVLATMARLELDERLVAVTEREAELVLVALVAGLEETGVPLTPELEQKVRQAAASRLRVRTDPVPQA
jgi:hypothetical protein